MYDMNIGVIIVAAGRGIRAGEGLPKQYRPIGGLPVLEHTLRAFIEHPAIGSVKVVIGAGDSNLFAALPSSAHASVSTCLGGDSRTESVRAGLNSLAEMRLDHVLIHDAARPFVESTAISALIEALKTCDAVIPALPSTDALMQLDRADNVTSLVDKATIYAAQTPQAFDYQKLVAAYAELGNEALPDDAAVAQRVGITISTISGDPANFKITTPSDFQRAQAMLTQPASLTVTGMGFDVHRLEPATSMTLCGVEIREGLGLVGHSDADVALHALTDAILGAAGAGDIGQHFPPSDPQWAGASSDRFVTHAVNLLEQSGRGIAHADITIIAERPKVGPHREAMRNVVAKLLKLAPEQVNIKATTTEGLGYTGRGEGIAAQAVVSAVRYETSA
jgi:2-C-methyl-D-erythritol 4-phosphate cytidylyltransferase/2-C-methyl-D-erythritol 2,4-cyclodiphosphate synthase